MRGLHRHVKSAAALAAIVSLAACGGHSGNVLPSAHATPQNKPAAGGTAQGVLRLTVPASGSKAAAKRRAFISPSTKSVQISFTNYPSLTQTLNVTPDSPGCSADQSGNTVCTLAFGAPAGSITYTVTAYDAANNQGNELATATASMNVVAGEDNHFDITLDGEPANVTVTPSQSSIPGGTAADVPVAIAFYDADNNLIVNSPEFWSEGAAFNELSINGNGLTGEFSFSQNGTALDASDEYGDYTIEPPYTNVSVRYSGSYDFGVEKDSNGQNENDATFVVGEAGTGSNQLPTSGTLAVTSPPQKTISEYPLGANTEPMDIATGPDKNLWVTQLCKPQSSCTTGMLAQVTIAGQVTEFPVPDTSHANNYVYPCEITSGPNGDLWFTISGGYYSMAVGEMKTDGTLTEFPNDVNSQGAAGGGCGGGITTGADGNLWHADFVSASYSVSAYSGIDRTNTTGTGTLFDLPWQCNTAVGVSSTVTGSDGNVWFIQSPSCGQTEISKITPSGTVSSYPVTVDPRSLTAGPDGALWFIAKGYLGRMTTSGDVTLYPIRAVDPIDIVAGSDGSLWYTDDGAPAGSGGSGEIGRVTTTGVYTLYPIPTKDSGPWDITSGPDGKIWFTESDTDQVGTIGP